MCEFREPTKKLINEPDGLSFDFRDSFGSIDDNMDEYIPSEENTIDKELKSDSLLNINRPLNNARSIWGAVVMLLRKTNMMTLHTACGEIRDVELVGNVLKVNVKEEYLYRILNTDVNRSKLLEVLRQVKEDLTIDFVLQEKKDSASKKNLERLKGIFGSDLEVM